MCLLGTKCLQLQGEQKLGQHNITWSSVQDISLLIRATLYILGCYTLLCSSLDVRRISTSYENLSSILHCKYPFSKIQSYYEKSTNHQRGLVHRGAEIQTWTLRNVRFYQLALWLELYPIPNMYTCAHRHICQVYITIQITPHVNA